MVECAVGYEAAMQAEPPEQSQENFSPRSHNSPQDPANVRSKEVERRSGWAMGSFFMLMTLFLVPVTSFEK